MKTTIGIFSIWIWLPVTLALDVVMFIFGGWTVEYRDFATVTFSVMEFFNF